MRPHDRAQTTRTGSALLLSLTADYAPKAVAGLVAVYEAAGIPLWARRREQVARFVDGVDVLGAGLVSCQRWNPDLPDLPGLAYLPAAGVVSCYGIVARR